MYRPIRCLLHLHLKKNWFDHHRVRHFDLHFILLPLQLSTLSAASTLNQTCCLSGIFDRCGSYETSSCTMNPSPSSYTLYHDLPPSREEYTFNNASTHRSSQKQARSPSLFNPTPHQVSSIGTAPPMSSSIIRQLPSYPRANESAEERRRMSTLERLAVENDVFRKIEVEEKERQFAEHEFLEHEETNGLRLPYSSFTAGGLRRASGAMRQTGNCPSISLAPPSRTTRKPATKSVHFSVSGTFFLPFYSDGQQFIN